MASQPITVDIARRAGRSMLADLSDTPWLDADLIVAETLAIDRNLLDAIHSRILNSIELTEFEKLMTRRVAGEPVAYLTGHKAFWNIELSITPKVLVPRPETELVVERALHHCRNITSPAIADLGTGSGAIALALANELGHSRLIATDISIEALSLAHQNSERLNLSNVKFIRGSWCEPLTDNEFDLIVANPPYIAENDPCLEDRFMQHEPHLALVSGNNGLQALKNIITTADPKLKLGGWLVIEHGAEQGNFVRSLMRTAGFNSIETLCDLAGLQRVTEASKTP